MTATATQPATTEGTAKTTTTEDKATETNALPAINEDGTINDPVFKAHIIPKWYAMVTRLAESVGEDGKADLDDKVACETFGDILADIGGFQWRGKPHTALTAIEEATGSKVPTSASAKARPATFDLVVEQASSRSEWRTMTKQQRNDFVYEIAEKAGLLETIKAEMVAIENGNVAETAGAGAKTATPEVMVKITEVTDRMGNDFANLNESEQNLVRVKVAKRIGVFEDLQDWINSKNDENIQNIESEVANQEVSEFDGTNFAGADGAEADAGAADDAGMDGNGETEPAADAPASQEQLDAIQATLDELLATIEQKFGDADENLVSTGTDGDSDDKKGDDDDKSDDDDDDDKKSDDDDKDSKDESTIAPATNPNPESVPTTTMTNEDVKSKLKALTEEEIKTILMKVKDPKPNTTPDATKSPTPSASFTAVPEVDSKKSSVGKVAGGVEKGPKKKPAVKDMGCTTRPNVQEVKTKGPIDPVSPDPNQKSLLPK